jgi:hypothetical protein
MAREGEAMQQRWRDNKIITFSNIIGMTPKNIIKSAVHESGEIKSCLLWYLSESIWPLAIING